MSQTSQSINLRKQFRIGNCNFALDACRWKSINFRQKGIDNDFISISKQPNTSIPNIRLHQTSIVLSDHIYMFGGVIEGAASHKFCAINLKNNKWHELKSNSNPSHRDSHGLTVLQQEIYLFGGSNQQTYFNDLYSFNTFTNEWKIIQNKGEIPSPRDSFIFVSVKNEFILLIGGIDLSSEQKYKEDLYIWKNGEWKSIKANYPNNVILSKAVQINGRIFVFGGINRFTRQYNSILYEVIVNQQNFSATFNQLKLSIQVFPQGRVNHQIIKINSQYFIVVGGQKMNTKIHKDIWIFDLFTSRWTRVEPKNGPLRGIHSFSAVMHNNIIYLIGGFLQNRKQINDLVLTIQFANEEIFKSQICENCVNLLQKKQIQSKKFPKDLSISVGFLYNMALEIKFPFHAISMLYQASKYFNANQFRIISQKTLNNFNYLRIQFDGCSFGREQFISFISHLNYSPQLKKFTQQVKLGALRLGKTFLFVSSDKKFRYVYLLSAQSRVSPHFDEAYVYYCYIQNIDLQRIQTEEGTKQRQLILNILKTHILKPQVLLSTPQKSLFLIFQNKVVMSSQKDYICQLQAEEYDIKVWKNQKKVQFLQQRGYFIRDQIEISLRKWMTLYYANPSQNQTQFYFNENQEPVKFIRYKDILDIYAQKGIIHKVQLPTDSGVQISGELYITSHPQFLQNNYGLLIYSLGHLYSRYSIDFGKLFPQYFYKSKYKQAKTIFYELGYINVEKGLEQNFFKNGFAKAERYSILLQKIQEKCDEKRDELLLRKQSQKKQGERQQQNKTSKKVKL